MASIARQLGISRTTVSLVLKGEAERFRISSETRDRVLHAVERLGYKPNYFATALNSRRTRVVGIVFPNVFESFMSKLVKGIEDVLYPADYTMMLCTNRFDYELESRLIDELFYRGVDGLLLVPTAPFRGACYDDTHLRVLRTRGMPFVLVDRYLNGLVAHRVTQDDYGGAYLATKTLAADGCRRIGYVSLDIDVSSIRARHEGYRAALQQLGMGPHEADTILLSTCDPHAHDLTVALQTLLASPERPDGLLVSTHGISLKVCHVVQRAGFALNTDIRIATFGTDPPYHATGMYCIEQPHVEMGRRAAKLLLEIIGKDNNVHPRHICLKSTLRPPGDRYEWTAGQSDADGGDHIH